MYQLLAGKVPFQGEIVAILMQIITKQPEPPSSQREVDQRLERICLQMMAKEIENRPKSMRHVASELTKYLKNSDTSDTTALSHSATKRLEETPALPHSQMSTDTPAQTPRGLDTPAQTPRGLDTPAQTPRGLDTPAQTPRGLDTPAQTPRGLDTPAQTPRGLDTPAQTPRGLDTPAQTPRGLTSHEELPPSADETLPPSTSDAPLIQPTVEIAASTPNQTLAESVKTVVTEKPRSTSEARQKPPGRKLPIYLAGAGLVLLVMLGTIFLFPTKNGVIRVEIHDPDVEVVAKSSGLLIRGADSNGKTISVSPGVGEQLKITRGELEFNTKDVQVKRGGQVIISVTYEAGKLSVTKDGKPFGSKSDVIAMVPSPPKQNERASENDPVTHTQPDSTPPQAAKTPSPAFEPFPPNGDKPVPMEDDPSNPYVGPYGLEPIVTLPWSNSARRVSQLSPDGRYLAFAASPKQLEVRDLLENKVVMSWDDLAGKIACMEFSPNSTQLAVSTTAPDVSIWELRSGKRVHFDQLKESESVAPLFTTVGQSFVSSTEKIIRYPEDDGHPSRVFVSAKGIPQGLTFPSDTNYSRLFVVTAGTLYGYIERKAVPILSGIDKLDALEHVGARWLVVSYRDSSDVPHLAVGALPHEEKPSEWMPKMRQIDLGNLKPVGGFAVAETGHYVSHHAGGLAVHDLDSGKLVELIDIDLNDRGPLQKSIGANVVVTNVGEQIELYRLTYQKKAADANQHRLAAEWAQTRGGRVGIETPEGIRYLQAREELPSANFVVAGLDLREAKLTGSTLRELPFVPTLKELRLPTYGDAWLAGPVAGRFSQLEMLRLSFEAPYATLRHVAQVKSLRQIIAYRTKFTNDDLKNAVRDYPHLAELNLYDTQVTPEGLLTLLEIKNLAHLEINPERLTPEFKGQLQTKFPGIKIR